jgi:HD-like signal output (HDOD) protein
MDLELETRPTDTPWALDNLPPFPLVAVRLVQLLSDPEVEIASFSRMLGSEPVFAARVLQMANSPLFGLERRVKSIAHAIVVLGLARVKSVILTRALGDFVAPALNVKASRGCWRSSLAGALIAERLAGPCRMDRDAAYVAGLLRDVGRLALLVKYPGPYSNLLAGRQLQASDLKTIERGLFEVDHCDAGAWLMEKMRFPPELCEVAARHHDVLNGEPFRMVHLVRIADLMADALGFAPVTPVDGRAVQKALKELPPKMRSQFGQNTDELRAEIAARIQAWE